MGCAFPSNKAGRTQRRWVALYFMYYDFGRAHQTLRVTPAMETGIADHVWSIEEIVQLLHQGRGSLRKDD